MILRIWDVEHGACATLFPYYEGALGGPGKVAMIDCGSTADWTPADYIGGQLKRTMVDYLYITNADQDHMSGIKHLVDSGITIGTFGRNPSYTPTEIRAIKLESGELTPDAEWYVAAVGSYNLPVDEPFNEHMGGITRTTFYNEYGPDMRDTNNLSLALFVQFATFTILFPGDLERKGWLQLLQRADFRKMLTQTDILVASHHGRENGFCPEVFEYCKPQAVVISDKPIVHSTQEMVPDYRNVVEGGVKVATTDKVRHVLTTRRDGWIEFEVDEAGGFWVRTECHG